MSGGSVGLLIFGSGRRELGFEFSLRGADEISTPNSDLPEPSLSGPFSDGPQNGPNRTGPFWTPKSSKFDHALNSKTIRIRPPPESENLAPRSGPPGTSDLDLPTDPLEELPSVQNFHF